MYSSALLFSAPDRYYLWSLIYRFSILHLRNQWIFFDQIHLSCLTNLSSYRFYNHLIFIYGVTLNETLYGCESSGSCLVCFMENVNKRTNKRSQWKVSLLNQCKWELRMLLLDERELAFRYKIAARGRFQDNNRLWNASGSRRKTLRCRRSTCANPLASSRVCLAW